MPKAPSALQCFLALLACLWFALARGQYASDDNRFDGDHLRFRTNADGFTPNSGTDKTPKCAVMGSQLAVRSEASDGTLTVHFFHIAGEDDLDTVATRISELFRSKKDATKDGNNLKKALEQCVATARVNAYTAYTIKKADLEKFDFVRSGVTFGGLVVPFKFRLGGDRGVVSSSTVAPYVGYRTPVDPFGLRFTPVLSAGLGLVPVTDPKTAKTETKNAFSIAGGFVMGSSKNDKFNSGFLLGRDVLSRPDREMDPNVSKWWMSFYLGVSL